MMPKKTRPNSKKRRQLLESIRAAAQTKMIKGPKAARSQDFLYNDKGIPQ